MIKTINTGVAELVLVKVPEDATIFRIRKNSSGIDCLTYPDDPNYPYCGFTFKRLPENTVWEILGIANELTEDIWHSIVKESYFGFYKDYVANNDNACDTATESGLSLLWANEVYSVNPYGDRPDINDYVFHGYILESHRSDLQKWDKAQETTGKWVVLKKTNV